MKTASLENNRHSLAHLLAAAVMELYPDAKRTIGPAIDNGFFYDFQFTKPISDSDLPSIEKKMRQLLPGWTKFEKSEVSEKDAKKKYADNPFKLELIEEYAKGGLTLYKSGNFSDLCRGGHAENPAKEIAPDSFKLSHVAGAYWRGDEKNPMLTRIYGLAFASKKELDDYLKFQEEAKKRDHKKLGPELDLFTFSELVGAGLPLWTPRGTLIRTLLDDFVWELRKKFGYHRVEIPHITKKDLYEKSGHWDKFKNELFRIQTREGHVFAMKPMNCPHHTQIYARKQWSYRDLPQRYANTTMVYRDEQTGELSGLSRVRSITQDDAHVFCRADQNVEEMSKIWEIIEEFYKGCGFPELEIRLSFHDPKAQEKYLGTPKLWKTAEAQLEKLVKSKKAKAEIAIGEAAFYGPKIDFMANDSLGREWQVATIQLDMNMPERFDLSCVNEKGEQERIVMIHAAIMGSIERFMSVLIEHFAGAFPLWLSPVQVAVLPINDKVASYARSISKDLMQNNVRVELDDRNESIGKKIREAEKQKIPYMLIIGGKEAEAGTVSIRGRGEKDLGVMKHEEFIEKIKNEAAAKAAS
ncbi:MAG: threonine--tRNA ligase [Candidatus Doudnabacteria bacterium RIFCSPHIGHO2_02_FULL_48_21]|nr:MAG: threonine--tRNA ligase [Candidatus Doudnabacteria bacterium RIFCSPHIGHO2_02_FULL_48_21]OGF02158.1 MAG: threonine--tRNA ligase [Candidatus Doudnabacteria bacterium RIFCSPLOWO2_12_FULL_47_12]